MIEGVPTRQQRRAKERARRKHDPMYTIKSTFVLATPPNLTITYNNVVTNETWLPIGWLPE